MNIADRALALVDLALLLRFAFIELEPELGRRWRDWVHTQCGVPVVILEDIKTRMTSLNDEIAADPNLGLQFRIGHSYVTPPADPRPASPGEWFRDVVYSQIGPLLEEYWFDNLSQARKTRDHLLAGWQWP